jgi:hypothetical protein
MSNLNPTLDRVTDRIIERSKDSRRRYLDLIELPTSQTAMRCPVRTWPMPMPGRWKIRRS